MATENELPLNLKRWLVGVGDKLNHEGQQLLKLLYYYDLPYAKLAKEDEIKDLFELSRGFKSRSDEATLALFLHRLSILVPRDQSDAEDPEEMMNIKNLGAQDCLNHLGECGLSPPPIQAHDISQESRLLECLVTVYVNVSQRKRRELRQQIVHRVGLNYENFGIFELFCKFLQKLLKRNVLDEFVNALNNAPAPKTVVENLIHQLDDYSIPHTLSADEINAQEESKKDYIKEEKALTIREEVHIINTHRPMCKCTKRRITCYIAACLPVALVILAIAVSIAALSAYNKSDESTSEASSQHQHCVNSDRAVDTGVPLMRLGSVSNFWYRDVLIVPDIDSTYYKDVGIQFFVVPTDFVIEQTKQFSCSLSSSNDVLFHLNQLYLLQGSTLSFKFCIKSDSPGFVTLNIFDNIIDFNSNENFYHQQQFFVSNGTNCSKYVFTAPRDNLYYALSCDKNCNSTNASLISYRIDANMTYVSSTHWINTSYSGSVCQLNVSNKECRFPIDKGNNWFFSAKTYDIFANITSGSTFGGPVGHLKIQALFRSTVYIVPVVIGGILLVMIYICCGVGCCACKVKGQKPKQQELEER